jgi:hypothetical protein
MKLSILLFTLFFSAQSFSKEITIPTLGERVDAQSLKLLGRGIEDRKTKEMIGLACLSEDCTRLRGVHFDANRTNLHYFGPVVKVSSKHATPTASEIRRFFRKLNRAKKDTQEKLYEETNRKLGTLLFGASSAGTLKILSIIIPAGVSPMFIIPVMLGTFGIVYGLANWGIRGKSSIALADQSGWNWSIRPKTVSHHSFISYMHALCNGTRLSIESIDEFEKIEQGK